MQLKWPMLWDLFSLFPAHAGVILFVYDYTTVSYSFPRTRGGDPTAALSTFSSLNFSPHTRG